MLLERPVVDELLGAAVVSEPPIKEDRLPVVPEDCGFGVLGGKFSSSFLRALRLASSCNSPGLAAAAISLDFFSLSSLSCLVIEERIGACIAGDPRNSSLRMYAWQINIAISNSSIT